MSRKTIIISVTFLFIFGAWLLITGPAQETGIGRAKVETLYDIEEGGEVEYCGNEGFCVVRRDDDRYLYINQEVFGPYDQIGSDYVVFNGSQYAYAYQKDDSWFVGELGPYQAVKNLSWFNGQLVFLARQDDQWMLVPGGEKYQQISNLMFGDEIIYQAFQDDAWYLVVGSEVSGPYDQIQESTPVLDENNNLYYVVKEGEKWYLVSPHNLKYGPFDNISAFSLKLGLGSFSYLAQTGEEYWVYYGEEIYGPYLSHLALDMSVYGQNRFAHVNEKSDGWYAVVDGVEHGPDLFITDPVFDKQDRLIWRAMEDKNIWWIRTEEESYGPYLDIRYDSLSADNGFVYIAETDKGWHCGYNGELSPSQPKVIETYGGRACLASDYDFIIYLDGQEIGRYQEVGEISFYQNKIIYTAFDGQSWYVYHGSRRSEPYEEVANLKVDSAGVSWIIRDNNLIKKIKI